MSNAWQKARLGEILRRSAVVAEISPEREYDEITVKLWGKGVVRRGRVSGAAINSSRRFVARRDQLIVSRIDARNGALGIVPDNLDGAVVTSDFPLFDLDRTRIDPAFLKWLTKTPRFVELCRRASEGTTNRVRLKEERFLALAIRLPPVSEQQRIAARLKELEAKASELQRLRDAVRMEQDQLLLSLFRKITAKAERRTMEEVAPIVRRGVQIEPWQEYPEIGIRSFGRGTFHKPGLSATEVGTKKLYRILPGDLVFSNVFAWEGAVAVARDKDAGRYGSHRFITCVPRPGIATGTFLRFYFFTPEGLAELDRASPGGAGRNRTLGLKALEKIEVPIIGYGEQLWLDRIQEIVETARTEAESASTDLDTFLASILDRAFKGEI